MAAKKAARPPVKPRTPKSKPTTPAPSAKKTGRRSKLSKTVVEKIVAALRDGNTRRCAAQSAGVSEARFYDWLKRGESGEAEFREFREAVEGAEAQCEIEYAGLILKAARAGEWKAALEWLKRRKRAEWGDSLDVRKLDNETLIALLEADASHGGGEAPAPDPAVSE